MKIKLNSSFAVQGGLTHPAGAVVDWPDDDDARRMIKAGAASPVEAQRRGEDETRPIAAAARARTAAKKPKAPARTA